MTNKEAIEIIKAQIELPCGIKPNLNEALDLAIKALKDVERLEEENHRNFVNSQHIISLLVEENKKLRGKE